MSDTSPNLELPLIAPSQAMKHVTHNEALLRLDAITQLSVEALGATMPPAAPEEGVCYGLGVSAQGAWSGQDGDIAVFSNGGWQFLTPQPGWRAWNVETAQLAVFSGGQWLPIETPFQNVDGLGINSTFDATNRLSVTSQATLLNHEGAGHQLKINKAAETDTASLLFQSDFDGHAEIGLTGDNDLAFKVSADGTNFATALRVRNTDGTVDLPSLRSGRIFVEKDTVSDIPTPGDGGMIAISLVNPVFPQTIHSGLFSYDAGNTLSLMTLAKGTGINNANTTVLSGTTGPSGQTSLSVQPGLIQLENQFAANSFYTYTFLNTY